MSRMLQKEELKKIPAICRVLVEYEKLYNMKDAREMFEILLDAILDAGFTKNGVERKKWAISKKPKELNNNREYNFISYNQALADWEKNIKQCQT